MYLTSILATAADSAGHKQPQYISVLCVVIPFSEYAHICRAQPFKQRSCGSCNRRRTWPKGNGLWQPKAGKTVAAAQDCCCCFARQHESAVTLHKTSTVFCFLGIACCTCVLGIACCSCIHCKHACYSSQKAVANCLSGAFLINCSHLHSVVRICVRLHMLWHVDVGRSMVKMKRIWRQLKVLWLRRKRRSPRSSDAANPSSCFDPRSLKKVSCKFMFIPQESILPLVECVGRMSCLTVPCVQRFVTVCSLESRVEYGLLICMCPPSILSSAKAVQCCYSSIRTSHLFASRLLAVVPPGA